jgi:uncharacterized membrane protein
MASVLLVLFYLVFPLLILHFCHRYRFINKIGAVVVAYVVGFIIGNTGIIPLIPGAGDTLNLLTTFTVPVAIPLLLFSMDIRRLSGIAGKTLLSLFIAIIAVTATVFAGFFIFRNRGIEGLPDVAGMMIGLYTGSTPNLASIQLALGADETNYMVIVTYDLVVGAFHLLFVMTVAQRLFLTFLPRYKFIDEGSAGKGDFDGEDPYWGMLKKSIRRPLLKAFGAALLIFGIGGATTLFIPDSSQMAVVILLITSLGIGASLIPAINRIEKSFELGMYLIMIFCMSIASLADLRSINFVAVMIAAYVALVVFGSMLIQALLSKLFKIDADTFLITSTAMICNPALVPVVAGALRNREIIFPGISVGIIGYAIGNYLGIFMAWFLEKL